MNEQQAREAIAVWAKRHYAEDGLDAPAVEVISPTYDRLHAWWQAEVITTTSAGMQHACVTFWRNEVGILCVGVEWEDAYGQETTHMRPVE